MDAMQKREARDTLGVLTNAFRYLPVKDNAAMDYTAKPEATFLKTEIFSLICRDLG